MSETQPAVVPATPPATPLARARKGWDIGLSIALLVCAIIAYAIGAIVGYFALAFFGSCNGSGCSGDGWVAGLYGLPFVVGLGIIATVVMLIIKRRGWWTALATVLLVSIGWLASPLLG